MNVPRGLKDTKKPRKNNACYHIPQLELIILHLLVKFETPIPTDSQAIRLALTELTAKQPQR